MENTTFIIIRFLFDKNFYFKNKALPIPPFLQPPSITMDEKDSSAATEKQDEFIYERVYYPVTLLNRITH